MLTVIDRNPFDRHIGAGRKHLLPDPGGDLPAACRIVRRRLYIDDLADKADHLGMSILKVCKYFARLHKPRLLRSGKYLVEQLAKTITSECEPFLADLQRLFLIVVRRRFISFDALIDFGRRDLDAFLFPVLKLSRSEPVA